jgi:hypothetical protein
LPSSPTTSSPAGIRRETGAVGAAEPARHIRQRLCRMQQPLDAQVHGAPVRGSRPGRRSRTTGRRGASRREA